MYRNARPLVIFGLGDFARLMQYHFTSAGTEVTAFTVDRKFASVSEFGGLPVIPVDDLLATYPIGTHDLFLAIGYKNMRMRQALFHRMQRLGYCLRSYVSENAIVSDNVAIGQNNVVLAGAILEPFVSVGDNNIIWSQSLICHDSRIGSHNFLAAQSLLGGCTVLGDCCFIGFGATVTQHLRVANETLLGAKSLLLSDSESCTRYLGTPARVAGEHRIQGICIEDP